MATLNDVFDLSGDATILVAGTVGLLLGKSIITAALAAAGVVVMDINGAKTDSFLTEFLSTGDPVEDEPGSDVVPDEVDVEPDIDPDPDTDPGGETDPDTDPEEDPDGPTEDPVVVNTVGSVYALLYDQGESGGVFNYSVTTSIRIKTNVSLGVFDSLRVARFEIMVDGVWFPLDVARLATLVNRGIGIHLTSTLIVTKGIADDAFVDNFGLNLKQSLNFLASVSSGFGPSTTVVPFSKYFDRDALLSGSIPVSTRNAPTFSSQTGATILYIIESESYTYGEVECEIGGIVVDPPDDSQSRTSGMTCTRTKNTHYTARMEVRGGSVFGPISLGSVLTMSDLIDIAWKGETIYHRVHGSMTTTPFIHAKTGVEMLNNQLSQSLTSWMNNSLIDANMRTEASLKTLTFTITYVVVTTESF